MPTNVLMPVEDDADRATVHLNADVPAFTGNGDTDWACPHCRRTLARRVAKQKVWDIVVRCGRCEGLSEFPRLPTGAWFQGNFLFMPVGTYNMTGSIELGDGITVGEGAVKEGGTRFSQS